MDNPKPALGGGGYLPIVSVPESVTSGTNVTTTVSISVAQAADIVVALTTSPNSTAWQNYPASVTIPAGQTSASFQCHVRNAFTGTINTTYNFDGTVIQKSITVTA